jgi:hypothetical protein
MDNDERQGGEASPQLEVTPEMIEAGLEAVRGWYPQTIGNDGKYGEEAVKAVIEAAFLEFRKLQRFS